MTVAENLRSAIPILAAAGIETPRLDAQLLLAWVLKARREDLAREPERDLPHREQVIFGKAVDLRAQRRPLPYITGKAWFYGRDFKVNRAVLIPRPETEILVDLALRLARERDRGPLLVADIGTGSGCIGVSIACELPNSTVVATDISRLALLVADKNRRRHRVADRIDLREGDLCAPLAPDERFDLILSNPPYIPVADAPALMPEVRDYEPALALYGADPADMSAAGLTRRLRCRLLSDARGRLSADGGIGIEIGFGQAEEAIEDARALGYDSIEIVDDRAGIGRILEARFLS